MLLKRIRYFGVNFAFTHSQKWNNAHTKSLIHWEMR
ncbi:hypothetical protein AT05_10575 [Schleiferia thermophila str. Yellowstone]|nr:hypothetical protein AT05_10575 [Schleiferia thermophila str. Yellowstone]